jgi:hypothetical protein
MLVLVQSIELIHLIFRQFKVVDVSIGADPLRGVAFWKRNKPDESVRAHIYVT